MYSKDLNPNIFHENENVFCTIRAIEIVKFPSRQQLQNSLYEEACKEQTVFLIDTVKYIFYVLKLRCIKFLLFILYRRTSERGGGIRFIITSKVGLWVSGMPDM